MLLAKGADVNAKATDGSTALIDAALGNDDAIAQLLPSSPSSKDDRLDIVQALLAKGAEVNAKQKNGATALMMASLKGRFDIVRVLLAKGADVNAKEEHGGTALDAAAAGGHADTRALLAQAQFAQAQARARALAKRAEGFLKQMPEPDRVMADIHGSDLLDTAARQATALSRLADAVMLLSGQNSTTPGGPQLTGEARNFYIRYRQASWSVSATVYKSIDPDDKQRLDEKSKRNQWTRPLDGYYRDEKSVTALLKPYLTPDLLEIYLQLAEADGLIRR